MMKKMEGKALLKKYRMVCILLLLLIFFSVTAKNFFTLYNLTNIVLQTAYVVTAGAGISLIMISGGVDLSVGYQMSLISVTCGIVLSRLGLGLIPAVASAVACGVLCGLLNGLLVVKLRVFPLMITLATSYIFQGISYIISQSNTFLNFSPAFLTIGQGYIASRIPVAVVIMAVVVILVSLLLSKTVFGRYIYGIGSNEEAMRLAGVNVNRMRVLIYSVSGIFVGLATVIMISRAGAASSNMGVGTEFTCLAGGVLGGIAFNGGEGRVSHMLVGILIIQVLSNGMQLFGLGVYPQYITKGIVLCAAVGFDSYQKRMKEKKKPVAAA